MLGLWVAYFWNQRLASVLVPLPVAQQPAEKEPVADAIPDDLASLHHYRDILSTAITQNERALARAGREIDDCLKSSADCLKKAAEAKENGGQAEWEKYIALAHIFNAGSDRAFEHKKMINETDFRLELLDQVFENRIDELTKLRK